MRVLNVEPSGQTLIGFSKQWLAGNKWLPSKSGHYCLPLDAWHTLLDQSTIDRINEQLRNTVRHAGGLANGANKFVGNAAAGGNKQRRICKVSQWLGDNDDNDDNDSTGAVCDGSLRVDSDEETDATPAKKTKAVSRKTKC